MLHHLNIRDWTVPIVNLPVLGMSQVEWLGLEQHIKELLQIILLVGTIIFTYYQVVRIRGRIKHENRSCPCKFSPELRRSDLSGDHVD